MLKIRRSRDRLILNMGIFMSGNGGLYTETHDDVIKWKHFPRYWPFVRGIHRSPVPGEFPTQRPMTRSFDVFFDLRLNKRLSKQSWGWWFETLSRPLWRHRNGAQVVFFHDNLPMTGSGPDVCGVLSDSIIRNTEKDSSMVIPRESFSPEAAGT